MEKALTVYELNKYIKNLIANDSIVSSVFVKGEISNFKHHISGHFYFTLKDEKSLIKCVMFKSSSQQLKFKPGDGMKVIIRGSVSVFERDGIYQLYAENMQPDGLGSLHLAFEQLKERLAAEGMFNVSIKRKLPLLPASIGVVTSPKGSVIRDIINILSRRYSNVNVKILPVQVQGPQAAGQICRALSIFNQLNNVDVIILARGGGSLEDLWPFNEEIVARSIRKSEIPVISAVGHETDFTIADFAADLRAPTPSAAAELVVPNKADLKENIRGLKNRLSKGVSQRLSLNRLHVSKIMSSMVFRQPYNRVNQERLKLDMQTKYLQNAADALNRERKSKFAVLVTSLDKLSPLGSMARGYSIVRLLESGDIIRSIKQVRLGDQLQINVLDGIITCSANKLGEKNYEE